MSAQPSLAAIAGDDEIPVTVVVSRQVRPGREAEYEEWLTGVMHAAAQFEGHQGASVIRPTDHEHPEYVLIFRFDHYRNLRRWQGSEIRDQWLARAKPLIVSEAKVQVLTGMEGWFTLPGRKPPGPPPRYKMAVMTACAVYPISLALGLTVRPMLAKLPLLVGTAVMTVAMILLMTWAVMPLMTKLFYRWLYPRE